jgi:hypothetical protein
MQRTIETLIEITRDLQLEIINYNYARITFTDDEINSCKDKGHDVVKEVTDILNQSSASMKENLGVDISAEISGNTKNVVLIRGIGHLADSSMDEFIALTKIHDNAINKAISGGKNTSEPAFKSAIDLIAEKPAPQKPVPASVTKTEKTPVAKPSVPKPIAKPIKTTSAKPAPTPAIAAHAPVPQPTTGSGNPYFPFIDASIDEVKAIGRVDLARSIANKFNMSEDVANKIITMFMDKHKDTIAEDTEMIFKKTAA